MDYKLLLIINCNVAFKSKIWNGVIMKLYNCYVKPHCIQVWTFLPNKIHWFAWGCTTKNWILVANIKIIRNSIEVIEHVFYAKISEKRFNFIKFTYWQFVNICYDLPQNVKSFSGSFVYKWFYHYVVNVHFSFLYILLYKC